MSKSKEIVKEGRDTLTVKDIRKLIKGLKPDVKVFLSKHGNFAGDIDTFYKASVEECSISTIDNLFYTSYNSSNEDNDEETVILLSG